MSNLINAIFLSPSDNANEFAFRFENREILAESIKMYSINLDSLSKLLKILSERMKHKSAI